MVRLFGLLGLLGLGLFGVSLLPPPEVKRAGLTRDAAAPATPEPSRAATADPAPALRHLPEAVQRLADAPQSAALRPVVFGEATPIPVAAPAQAGPESRPDATALRDPGSPFRVIKAQRANIRTGPSTEYEVIGQLTEGEEVQVIERDGSWLLVRLEGDGFEGWISASLLLQ